MQLYYNDNLQNASGLYLHEDQGLVNSCLGIQSSSIKEYSYAAFSCLGDKCQYCAPGFVGDPTKGECRPCSEVCNNRAERCYSTEMHRNYIGRS